MEIYKNINDIRQLSIFDQLDHPVALTAPLIVDHQVIIGMYCEQIGSACILIDIHKFIDLKHFLFDPKRYRLLVHGIKRIWENREIGNLDTYTFVIADTEIMAYLLDSGRDETEYSLSYLAHQYLKQPYPHRSVEICDTTFPESMYEILTDDAYLIAEHNAKGPLEFGIRPFFSFRKTHGGGDRLQCETEIRTCDMSTKQLVYLPEPPQGQIISVRETDELGRLIHSSFRGKTCRDDSSKP